MKPFVAVVHPDDLAMKAMLIGTGIEVIEQEFLPPARIKPFPSGFSVIRWGREPTGRRVFDAPRDPRTAPHRLSLVAITVRGMCQGRQKG